MAAAKEATMLYKALLKEGQRYSNYNFRKYVTKPYHTVPRIVLVSSVVKVKCARKAPRFYHYILVSRKPWHTLRRPLRSFPRSYVLRRVKESFAEGRTLAGEEAAAALAQGKKDYEVVKRQATLSQMYSGMPSIMKK
eukprot:7271234-Pyramimonas_sp.AAC.2